MKKIFQDTIDVLAEFSTGIGKIKWLDELTFNNAIYGFIYLFFAGIL